MTEKIDVSHLWVTDDDVSVAPPEVLEMIKCGCTTDTPCSTAIIYSSLAICNVCFVVVTANTVNCQNERTRRVDIVDDCDSGDLSED
jgi:hypothetical protein